MSAASFLVVFGPVFVAVLAVGLYLCMMAASEEAKRNQGRRARELARYRHHPDANLLSLNDRRA
jgi:ABC-type transport system involved in cytochrome c biogenesis permease subunit